MRVERFFHLTALGAATLLALAMSTDRRGARASQPAPPPPAVTYVGMTVSDMERSLRFYTGVLPFRKLSDREVSGEAWERLTGVFACRMRKVRLRLGDEELELTEFLAPRGRPAPVDARSSDRWFQHVAIIVRDMDRAYALLHRNHVAQISPEPQRLPDWNPNAGGIRAFYFRDPDGHPLELLQFPEGKGDPRWHRPGARLFLGIDHTAIGVSNTATSLRFYRDLLGLRVAGGSENYGPEQERLSGVRGARVRITSLRGAQGPGIEFLEYLTPRDGRPYPADERANDLLHTETTLQVPIAAEVGERLKAMATVFVSPGTAGSAPGASAPTPGVIVRDPDGHPVHLTGLGGG